MAKRFFEVNIGDRFYDEHNSRMLTVDGVGCDPNCFSCVQEELTEDGQDLEITGRVNMMRNELAHMSRV